MNQSGSAIEKKIASGVLLLLLLGCLLVLWPFVTAMVWAIVLSISLWPLHRRVGNLLSGRQTLAAALVCLGVLLVVVLPFGVVTFTLSDNVAELKTAAQRWLDEPPAPPKWLAKVPLVGRSATERWSELAADSSKLVQEAKRLVEPLATWLLQAGLKLGAGMLQLVLSLLIAFFLLRNGPSAAAGVISTVQRIGGQRGMLLLELASNTIRGVVYGILGTALVQAVMAGIGFLIAGVPGAGLLALLVFFLSVVPMGPPLVMFPAAFWLFHQGSNGWGVFMLIWGVVVSTIDNFVKPWLISQGSDMPLILILFGVLGGAMAFGFIGVFIGPTLLAVGYRLVQEWSTTNRGVSDKRLDTGTPSQPATHEIGI